MPEQNPQEKEPAGPLARGVVADLDCLYLRQSTLEAVRLLRRNLRRTGGQPGSLAATDAASALKGLADRLFEVSTQDPSGQEGYFAAGHLYGVAAELVTLAALRDRRSSAATALRILDGVREVEGHLEAWGFDLTGRPES
jgi:hypothetical protein